MIKNAKRPAQDETFSSWLYRVCITRSASDYNAFTMALKAMITRERRAPEMVLASQESDQWPWESTDIDYDMDLIREVIGIYLSSFGVKQDYFASTFSLVVPHTMRNHYCPACLREDITAIEFPCWRKAWTYCMTAYCYQHKRLLVTMRSGPSTYDRAWQAFKEEASDSPSNAFRMMRDRLAIRVQRWYFRRPSFNTLGLENTQSTKALFDLTYSLLLKQRTRFEGGGYACALARENRGQVIPKSMPLTERIQIGVSISSPLQRSYALILTGMILGLILPSQITRFVGLAKQSGVPWPSTPFIIGKMAILYSNREEYLELRKLYSATPPDLIARCAEFFRGLEHAVYSLRDEYSSQDRLWLESGAPHQRWLVFPDL
ncbi:TniQ family protein [Pseudomonas putida]|uniref:TniQ family protein n=1 Tax=Pseudomonas putida TaxID=303 RepID=UPI001F5190C7|nr:TniQ family protein [Pseudomonas putida]MCI1024762.1 TniQ family protein [Pseudomonas putida]